MTVERPPLEQQKAEAIAEEISAYGGTFAEYNVVAAYRDMPSAKKAIDAIDWAGIDGINVSLLGRRAAEAATDTMEETEQADERLSRDIIRRVLVGGAAGVIIGLPLGLLAYAIYDELGLWVSILGGMIMFGIIGALLGGMWDLDANPQAEVTYHTTPPGHILVGVKSDRKQLVDRAEFVLEKRDPLMIHRYDARGHPI
jgi:hypothetical protein